MRLREWAAGLRKEIRALHMAYRHPSVPLPAKVLLLCVVACALSPVDLIPDFIPVLGQLDDLVLIPLGIWLATRMIPPGILAECRARAAGPAGPPTAMRWGVAGLIVLVWIGGAAALVWTAGRIWLAD